MKDRSIRPTSVSNPLASLGIALIVLLGWACAQPGESTRVSTRWVRSLFASLVIGFVSVVGWVVDHVPPISGDGRTGVAFLDPDRPRDAHR